MRIPVPQFLILPLIAAAFSLAALRSAEAAWPRSPTLNLPVSTARSYQVRPAAVPDGMGGVIVAWEDWRSGARVIYAQHVMAAGTVDAGWPADGLSLGRWPGRQHSPALVPDGAGGAIVAWSTDDYSDDYDIVAQHVMASGAVDPGWPAEGVLLSPRHSSSPSPPTIMPDGAGGAIIAWTGRYPEIRAQHLMASGIVDPGWPADGLALTPATSRPGWRVGIPDGAGGAIIVWQEYRAGDADIYAQHVLASGAVDGFWPADGAALCTATGAQASLKAAPDGAGGAIVVWQDQRAGTSAYFGRIYAQRVSGWGRVPPGWPRDGVAIADTMDAMLAPAIVPDGAGGAIVAWSDHRAINNSDIYAQHLLATGIGDPGWRARGVPLSAIPMSDQQDPTLVSDGAGGAVVGWADTRNGNRDLYAQHLMASGSPDPRWPPAGCPVSTGAENQDDPVSVSDGAAGSIFVWSELRYGSLDDIYAQRVDRFGYLGAEPTIAGVHDVPNDQGGRVKLSWDASYLDDPAYGDSVTSYQIFRSVPPNVATEAIARGVPLAARAPDRPPDGGPLLITTTVQGRTIYWEYVGSEDALRLAGYSQVVSTTGDSTRTSNPRTLFLVRAVRDGGAFWDSAPDSGYSVDNLAPLRPARFAAEHVAGAVALHWDPNDESDFDHYDLYRGSTPDFIPGATNLVASKPDTGYVDGAGGSRCYKLAAVDVHGNESSLAQLELEGSTDTTAVPPPAVWLGPASPNPTHGEALIRFALPRVGEALLVLYDQQGRLVRTLLHDPLPAGEHAVRWDGRRADGSPVPGGLYFYRLQAAGRTLAGRLAVIR